LSDLDETSDLHDIAGMFASGELDRIYPDAPVSPAPAGLNTVQMPASTPSRTRPSPGVRKPLPVPAATFTATTPPALGRHARAGRIRTKWEVRYVWSLVASDLLAGLFAGGVAFGARFGNAVTPYNRQYLLFTALLPMLLMASLGLNRAYERRFLFVGTDEYQRVLRAGLALTAMTAVVSYTFNVGLARGYVALALPLATTVSVGARFLLRKHLHHLRARGECLRRVIVVGHELAVVGLAHQLNRERYHGLEIVGCCLPPRHDGAVGMPVYGTFDDVAEAVEAARADTVIVLSCPELDGHILRRLGWRLEREDIDMIVANSLIDVAGSRTTVRPVDGLPMLHVEHARLSGAARAFKSVFDRVGAGLGLIVLAPVLFAIAAAVKCDSKGPVVFRQNRVGKGGREFSIFKFRTMYTDAESRLDALRHLNENDGVLFKIRDDPRITRVGRLMRRLSLDELPQLINVVLGDMSLVGPRPPLPEEVAAYPADMRRRLAVRPGITGLWQVSGRSDLSWAEAVRLDLRYVENWSFSLDCVILLRTLSAVCRSSGAY
jgi:exopolysaccharide biosynthesis polyprenyl glycosylphosphotransferase